MRKLLVTLLVLVVVLVAADFGARAYAENRVADAVQTRAELTSAPDVSIEGFPFLLHAVRGEYPEVVLTSANDLGGRLPGTRAELTLDTFRVPLGDAVAGDLTNATAEGTVTELLIPAASLSEALGRPDLEWSTGPDGKPTITTTVEVAGAQVPVSGTVEVALANETLTFTVGSLTAAGVDIPRQLTVAAGALASGLTLSVPLGALAVDVSDADVAVRGSDVVLTAVTGPVRFAELI